MNKTIAGRTIVAFAFFAAGLSLPAVADESGLGKIRTPEYRALQARLCSGWNTWYNDSMTAHVKLPEAIGFNFGLSTGNQLYYTRDYLKYSEKSGRPDWIVPELRSDDGAYTSARIGFRDLSVRLETVTDGEDLLALVTPLTQAHGNLIVVEPIVMSGGEGTVGSRNGRVFAESTARIELGTTGPLAETESLQTSAPRIAAVLDPVRPLAFFTGRARTVEEVGRIVAARRAAAEARVASFGDKAEAFKAMQTILAWNNIYDAPNHRLIAPVSRVWNHSWGGWVLFDWDTYFAAYMCSLFNRDLAFAHAVEITKCITDEGFIPNYKATNGLSADRSQPPVGSRIVWEIYRRHPERWFLKEVYAELLSWNRWWPEARELDGYLCWGSHDWKEGQRVPRAKQDAMFESGLDNSPMFDDVPMSADRPVMMQADVGLMSMYVMDCKALAKIAAELGRSADRDELLMRGERYAAKLATLWDEERGIYMNRRLDTGAFNDVLSPCNFYPLLAGVPTAEQAERMVREHYFNPKEFHGTYVMPSSARNARGYADNSYWRGRIWAPLNLLVYLGFRDYRLDEARHDLIVRSNDLLMKNWRATGGIYENYNAETGVGGDVGNSDGFYHWGALLAYLSFLEEEDRR